MAEWHPIETVRAHSWIFPRPGTDEPLAEIRHLPVRVGEQRVWAFRAVTWAEPRELIGVGYFETLKDAAFACHRYALHVAIRPQLNETKR